MRRQFSLKEIVYNAQLFLSLLWWMKLEFIKIYAEIAKEDVKRRNDCTDC